MYFCETDIIELRLQLFLIDSANLIDDVYVDVSLQAREVARL